MTDPKVKDFADQLKDFQEKWNEQHPEGFNPFPVPYYPQHPCPSCGHCPTCGRGNGWPNYPQITWSYTTGNWPQVQFTGQHSFVTK